VRCDAGVGLVPPLVESSGYGVLTALMARRRIECSLLPAAQEADQQNENRPEDAE
jgi:hypothetical protein